MTEPLQPFLTVRELLADVMRLHGACFRRFTLAAGRAADLRARVLFGFLAEREREQWSAVARLGTGEATVLSCYVQSMPARLYAEALATACATGDCEQVAESYRQREAALEACFAQLEDTVGPRAATVFAALGAMKRQNQARLQEVLLDF